MYKKKLEVLSQSLDIQVLIIFEILMPQALRCGTGNRRPEINFEEMIKTPRDIIILYHL